MNRRYLKKEMGTKTKRTIENGDNIFGEAQSIHDFMIQ